MATAKKFRKSRMTITKFIQYNPNAKAGDIAKRLGVSVTSVYIARSKLRKLNTSSAKSEGVNIDAVHNKNSLLPDMINHPPHYKIGGVETIEFIEAKGLGYNLGNVVKYIARSDHKGLRKENLEKARWYLERELLRCE